MQTSLKKQTHSQVRSEVDRTQTGGCANKLPEASTHLKHQKHWVPSEESTWRPDQRTLGSCWWCHSSGGFLTQARTSSCRAWNICEYLSWIISVCCTSVLCVFRKEHLETCCSFNPEISVLIWTIWIKIKPSSVRGTIPLNVKMTTISMSSGWLWFYMLRVVCVCVHRAGWSHQRLSSPWTAMVFLSCRIVFPADACTVTVLMPSWENVHATLPSRVITGCWVGRRETGKTGASGERPLSHSCYFTLQWCQTHSNSHAHTHAEGCDALCGAAYTFYTHSSNNQMMPTLTSFITNWQNWLPLWRAPVVWKINTFTLNCN